MTESEATQLAIKIKKVVAETSFSVVAFKAKGEQFWIVKVSTVATLISSKLWGIMARIIGDDRQLYVHRSGQKAVIEIMAKPTTTHTRNA